MDHMKEIENLKNENEMYKRFIEDINAEKIALDQLLVENLKSSLLNKKNAILFEEKLKKLTQELEVMKQEKETISNHRDSLLLEKEVEVDLVN